MEGNIRHYRLPKGTDQWKCLTLAGGEGNISFTVRTMTQGQSVYRYIALHISSYCVYCIEDLILTRNINAYNLFKESSNLQVALHISNYCVYCIEDQNLTHNINAQI